MSSLSRLRRVRSEIRRGKRGQSAQRNSTRLRHKGKRPKRSLAVLFLLLLVWSICLGWGLSLAVSATVKPDLVAQATSTESGTVDPVPERYKLGKELYLENCASCHVALPPEVLPSETWRRVLLEPEQHYGTQVQQPIGPSLLIMWDYLRTFSRPEEKGKPLPYRVSESRFFKALHPRVKLPETVKPNSCVSCHPGVTQYNYRRLTPEWENSQ
jgi:hypothetical protein